MARAAAVQVSPAPLAAPSSREAHQVLNAQTAAAAGPPPGSAPRTSSAGSTGRAGSPSAGASAPERGAAGGSGAWGRRSRGNFLFRFDFAHGSFAAASLSLISASALRSPSFLGRDFSQSGYVPVDAAAGGLKSEHVVVCFQIQGCFWGKKD